MEQQPSFEPTKVEKRSTRRQQIVDFSKRLGRVLAGSLVGAVVYALLVGPHNLVGFADGLFLAGALLLVLGLLPLFSEMLGRATLSFNTRDRSVRDVLEEQRGRAQRGETLSYLFGFGGIIIIVLSFIISFSIE